MKVQSFTNDKSTTVELFFQQNNQYTPLSVSMQSRHNHVNHYQGVVLLCLSYGGLEEVNVLPREYQLRKAT